MLPCLFIVQVERTYQDMDVLQAEPQPPRFQRTDLWMPVYSWLESLDKTEIVKPNEIIDWLSENPGIREQLYSKHPRHQVMHYIQRCHFKMLRRREKQRKRMQGIPVPATRSQVIVNDGAPTLAIPLRCKISGTSLKDNEISLSKRNEALRRYELLTDLLNQLTSVLSSNKQANHTKESSSRPLLTKGFGENGNHHLSDNGTEKGNVRAVSGGMSHSQDLELASPIDLKNGIKRKRTEVEVTPGASYCEAVAGTEHP